MKLICSAVVVSLCLTLADLQSTSAGPTLGNAEVHSAIERDPQARLQQPRKQFPVSLHLLWRSDRKEAAAAALLYPADVHFSLSGLLVFDHGSKHIVAFNSANGESYFSVGRRGAGPGEFNGLVTFMGTSKEPMTVEFGTGRVTSIGPKGELAVVPVSHSKRWLTGCAWDKGSLLFQASGFGIHDYFVTTIGAEASTIDSLPLPWDRLQKLPFLSRQAGLRQFDDSTCAVLPLYNVEFALIAPDKPATLGVSIEELPIIRPPVESGEGPMRAQRVAPGSRPGAADARPWRDNAAVLFMGQTAHKRRVLDLYSRDNLTYRGSVLLPFETTRIAIRGDTLAVVGEDDLNPVVAVFLLR